MRTTRTLALFTIIILSVIGCASIPQKPSESNAVTFNHEIKILQKASTDALVVFGFDIKKDKPSYIEGYRPRKWGLVASSGGETVGIWLKHISDNKTQVYINTARTSFGIIGQKKWEKDILSEIEIALGEKK